jgi:ABC-2 type transport system ATP-binding protein
MLLIENYRKAYDQQLILQIPQFAFDNGIYWIKGPNGSGKSTFFKSICGIISFQGEVTLDSISLKKDPVTFRKKISYAEAEPQYPGFLTLKDLMMFVAVARKASTSQRHEIIELFGMGDYMEQPVKTYSSGMLKKASLALAFLGSVKVICLDEPFTTIDHESLHTFTKLINDYNEYHGVTFLISSHVEDPDIQLKYTESYKIARQTIMKLDELAI